MKYTEFELVKMMFQSSFFLEAAMYTSRVKQLERIAVRTFGNLPYTATLDYAKAREVVPKS